MFRKEARLIEGFMSLPPALGANGALKKVAENVMFSIVKGGQETNPGWYNILSSYAPDAAGIPASYSDLPNWSPPDGSLGSVVENRNDAMRDVLGDDAGRFGL